MGGTSGSCAVAHSAMAAPPSSTCSELELKSKTPLNDGNSIPVLGLGTFSITDDEAVCCALQHGYRLIGCSKIMLTSSQWNEEVVGRAIRKSGIPREDIFLTMKITAVEHGRQKTLTAIQRSLKMLGLDYLDLYMFHDPTGGKTIETWDTMVELKEKGLVKSIGVSNFGVHHLQQLKLARPNHIPAVNELELTPFRTQEDLVSYCHKEGIALISYSPLTKGKRLHDPPLVTIAERYNKSTAQILIRWCLQRGYVCIPKSVKEHRIVENKDVFDFEISPEDMQTLNGLNEDFTSCWTHRPDPTFSPWEP